MKILLGNNTLDILAGSETWTLTMAKELKRLGHDVFAYSDKLGFIATRLEKIGVKCLDGFVSKNSIKPYNFVLEDNENQKFDVVICAHHQIAGYLKHTFPDTPMITTIHGILHKNPKTGEIYPEHPNLDVKVDQFVAVSEEVQDILEDKYKIKSKIIRNPIDMDLFARQECLPGREIKGIMLNSNYQGKDDEVVNIIKDVSKKLHTELRAVGFNFQTSYDIQDIIKEVEIVVGMGRSLLEGLAMGKIGLVHGRWGTGGVITPDTIKKLAIYNYSGRNLTGKLESADKIIEMIEKSNTKENSDAIYEYMKQEHDVKVVAKKYLDIAEILIHKNNEF